MHRTDSFSRRLQLLPLLLLLSGLLSACAEPEQPVTVDIITLEELLVLPLPSAVYADVAWLDEQTLVFKHRQPPSPVTAEAVDRNDDSSDEGPIPVCQVTKTCPDVQFDDRFDDFSVSLYRLDTQELREVPLPTPPEYCADRAGRFGVLTRVPDARFGYIYSCFDREYMGISSILYLWDREQNRMVEYTSYPKPHLRQTEAFRAGSFSFAPDMSSLFQEAHDGLSPELYYVDAEYVDGDGDMMQLFPEFESVTEPSRSPDGKTVAFGGTAGYPFDTDETKTKGQIIQIYRNLYDLYLMDADGSNARLLLPQVGTLHDLTWSPDGERLFFVGRSAWGPRGIWMLELDTLEGVQIWPDSRSFVLSPDGRRIVILVVEDYGLARNPTQPTIFALPELPRD